MDNKDKAYNAHQDALEILAAIKKEEKRNKSETETHCPDCAMWLPKKAVAAPIALPDREKEDVEKTYGHSDCSVFREEREDHIQFLKENWRKNETTTQRKPFEANRAKCYSCNVSEGTKIHCLECFKLYCRKCLNPKRDFCKSCTLLSPPTIPQPTAPLYPEKSFNINKSFMETLSIMDMKMRMRIITTHHTTNIQKFHKKQLTDGKKKA